LATLSAVTLTQLWNLCTSNGIPRRSLIVAVVVGTTLNLVNQGDALLAGSHVNVVKLVLTYIVPYCVATYGAASFAWKNRTSPQ
jgi:hypothetical protein